ncbi:MAG: isocitrate lyase/phosphoenolpyruvate mutase family protein [Rhodobacteraceae bacterium]|nr:isocitrate lyase/phosphoenolpyruvate mutase family protein [Paracoccaceae bacterium]
MTQSNRAAQFAALHRSGAPLVLYNIWDVGSAQAVAKGGASAIATGSWAVARTQGFGDGEAMPLDQSLTILGHITHTVDLPVTFDFEAGYADTLTNLSKNTHKVIDAGAIGINFEDQRIGGKGLVQTKDQCARIAAIRQAADDAGIALFINARTDVFFKGVAPDTHPDLMTEALSRARAYTDAGANGLFVPGLADPDLIGQLCQDAPCPVNIMCNPNSPDIAKLTQLGVARISHGPGPFVQLMTELTNRAAAIYGTG